MSKNLFITGTGTDIGKTYVTALIIKKLHENNINAAYYKAAMSGNEERPDGSLIPGDALHVKTVSGIEQPLEEMCPYIYKTAVSPHLAAQIEGNPVEMEKVIDEFDNICSKYDYVTVEGSGGIVCPLRFDKANEKIGLDDFVKMCHLSCVVIADAGLGTINSVVLTVEYMRTYGIPVKGIIFNNYDDKSMLHRDNLFMCEYLTGLKVLACVKTGDKSIDISIDELEALYEENGGESR